MQHIRHTLSHTHTSQTVALGPSISRVLPMLATKRNMKMVQKVWQPTTKTAREFCDDPMVQTMVHAEKGKTDADP